MVLLGLMGNGHFCRSVLFFACSFLLVRCSVPLLYRPSKGEATMHSALVQLWLLCNLLACFSGLTVTGVALACGIHQWKERIFECVIPLLSAPCSHCAIIVFLQQTWRQENGNMSGPFKQNMRIWLLFGTILSTISGWALAQSDGGDAQTDNDGVGCRLDSLSYATKS